MTYTTEAYYGAAEQLELFSEADMETVQFEAAEFSEGIESLESLESVTFESVAEDLEGYMEGYTESRPPSSYVNKKLLQIFTALIKNLVKKITNNPKTRAKLQAACRKSPDAVAQLLIPILVKTMPAYFNWMPAIFAPPIVSRLYPAICKSAGLKAEEVPAGAEFWWLIPTFISTIGNLFPKKNRKRR